MPFHHLDQGKLEAARQTIAQHATWRETEPVLLQNPAPGAPAGITMVALAIIRWWAIRKALAGRLALARSTLWT